MHGSSYLKNDMRFKKTHLPEIGGIVMENKVVSIALMGDVVPNREKPESLFELVVPTLKQFDIRFCHLEDSLSDKGTLNIWARYFTTAHYLPPAKNVRALTYAGIDVVSFAGNHTMNFGYEGFLGTLENLEKHNIKVVGAGRNINEARRPAIIERNGIKVAFLGYNSIL